MSLPLLPNSVGEGSFLASSSGMFAAFKYARNSVTNDPTSEYLSLDSVLFHRILLILLRGLGGEGPGGAMKLIGGGGGGGVKPGFSVDPEDIGMGSTVLLGPPCSNPGG